MRRDRSPALLPVLSRGKHRTPRQGGCFMEMASVLAGEPWSDRPGCTHPLLGQLARLVNDHTSDDGRSGLAVLVPRVIGLRGPTGGGDTRWVLGVASVVATHVIDDVPEHRQRALASGLVRAHQRAEALGGTVPGTEGIEAALSRVPSAVAWARRFGADTTISERAFVTRSAPAIVECAVKGIVESASADCDRRLRALMEAALDTAQRLEPLRSGEPDQNRTVGTSMWPVGAS